ncbi:MAG: hypothetical protein ACJAZP_001884 [Psychromonas sp.]
MNAISNADAQAILKIFTVNGSSTTIATSINNAVDGSTNGVRSLILMSRLKT